MVQGTCSQQRCAHGVETYHIGHLGYHHSELGHLPSQAYRPLHLSAMCPKLARSTAAAAATTIILVIIITTVPVRKTIIILTSRTILGPCWLQFYIFVIIKPNKD